MREVPRPFLEKHQATPGNQGKDNHHRLEEPLRDRMFLLSLLFNAAFITAFIAMLMFQPVGAPRVSH